MPQPDLDPAQQPLKLCSRARLLDVREISRPGIVDAAHIPFSQLRNRMHELPSRSAVISIANTGAEACEAAAWLDTHGRIAKVIDEFRGQESPTQGRLWDPTSFLAQTSKEMKPGKALEIACGSGRDAVFLAGHGWDVHAVDHLADAIERAGELEQRYLMGASPIRWMAQDVEKPDWSPPDRYDLISAFRFLNRDLFSRVASWLHPQGSIVIETFTIKNLERHEKPSNEKFLLRPNELVSLFPTLTVRQYSEDWHDGVHTARLWAQRTG